MSVVAITVLQEYLRIDLTDTSQNSLLGQLQVDAVGMIEGFLGRQLEQTTTHEQFDIDDEQDTIWLKNFPIQSIAALTNDGSLVANADYKVYSDEGMIKLADRISLLTRRGELTPFFDEGKKSVEITYVGGFTTVPADIQSVIKRTVARMFNTGDKQGFKSEDIGEYEYTLADGGKDHGFSQNDLAVLQKYKPVLFLEGY